MKSKKIVLTTMPYEGEFVNWQTSKIYSPKEVKYMPLGILSLATNLPKKYDVVLLDPSSEGWDIDETVSKIEQEKPDILGLSVVTRRVYAMNQILKKTSAPYKVVGGGHANLYPELILRNGADAVFVGALADLEFRDAVDSKPKGIIYCNTDINDIKYPDRTLMDYEEYFPKASVLFKSENRLPMFSSIGCPNKCVFCNVQTKKIQKKLPEIVVKEMEFLKSIGSKSVHILDDNFNVYKSHIEGIMDEMEKKDFVINEWSGRGQVKMDLNIVKRLAEHNFKRIHVGIESLEEKTLQFFRKKGVGENIDKFCEEMNKYNIDIVGFFIFGAPTETSEYLETFMDKLKRLGIKSSIFNVLFPEPKTEYYESLLSEGLYKKDYWAEYMENPVADFEIPYPYGEKKKIELINYVQDLIEEVRLK